MGTEIVKVRLRSGDSEVEVEGPRKDVDQLLDKWWPTNDVSSSTSLNNRETKVRAVKRGKVTKRSSAKPPDEPAPSLDPVIIANDVKESDNFSKIEAKILHVTGDGYHKVAFVLWFAAKPLTSGDIFRVLRALDVRIDLPSVFKKHQEQHEATHF